MVIADGFACREMISQNTDRHVLHVAEAIRMAMTEGPSGTPGDYPERGNITDPDPAAKLRPVVWSALGLLGAALLVRAMIEKALLAWQKNIPCWRSRLPSRMPVRA